MAQPLKQSTTVTIRLGPFLDATDGVTEEAALSPAVEVSKNHGAFAARNSATAITHDSNGWYAVELNATDTNTLGPLLVKSDDSANHLPVWREFTVLPANSFDSLVAGSDTLNADVTQWLGAAAATPSVAGVPEVDITHLIGNNQSALDLQDFADAGYDPAVNKVEGVKTVDTTTTNTDMRGTDNAALASVLGALADAAADGDPTATDTVMQYVKQLINILVGTTGITTFPAEGAPANNVSLAEVIRAIHSDVTGLNGDVMRGTDNASLAADYTAGRAAFLDNLNGHTAQSGDSFARLGAPTGASVSADIAGVQADTDDIQTRIPAVGPVEGTADSGSTTTMVDAARTEADVNFWAGSWIKFTSGNLAGQVRLITAFSPSTDTITFAPAVTQSVSTHTYEIVPAAQIERVLNVTTNDDMRGTDSAALASEYTSGRAAFLDNLNGHTAQSGDSFARLGAPAGASVSADVAAVQADTDDIQTRIPAALVGGRMDSDVGAKSGNVALSVQEKADVNIEVLDVLNVDTLGELAQGVPPATPTHRQAIMLLYMALRNKRTTTDTQDNIHNDGGVVISKATLSDVGGTTTKEEYIAGP